MLARPEEPTLTVFAPMDSWIAAAGRTDDWLSLGLDLLERWQAPAAQGADQAHLVAVLAALEVVRPVAPGAPDPLALAVWFHHAASREPSLELSASFAYDRIAALGEPALAGEVARLIRQLGLRHPHPDDTAGGLLHAAHRAALSPTHLSALPPPVGDQ